MCLYNENAQKIAKILYQNTSVKLSRKEKKSQEVLSWVRPKTMLKIGYKKDWTEEEIQILEQSFINLLEDRKTKSNILDFSVKTKRRIKLPRNLNVISSAVNVVAGRAAELKGRAADHRFRARQVRRAHQLPHRGRGAGAKRPSRRPSGPGKMTSGIYVSCVARILDLYSQAP